MFTNKNIDFYTNLLLDIHKKIYKIIQLNVALKRRIDEK